MNQKALKNLFTRDFCDSLLPPHTSDRFFEALYGDVSEGAYDIRLHCTAIKPETVELGFHLTQRPGKCLVCSLTYGLPNVFARHPLINIAGMIRKIKDAGVPVTCLVYDQMIHAFLNCLGELDMARKAVSEMGALLKRAFERD